MTTTVQANDDAAGRWWEGPTVAEIDGFEYDEAECDRFIRCAAGIADVAGKIRAEEGDAYARRYLGDLFKVIRELAGVPD